MRNDSKVALLRRIPFLRSCPDRDLAWLAQHMDDCEVEPGTILTEEGKVGREFFIVVDGWAEVSCGGEAVAAVGPGEFIGEMAMLSYEPRSATVTAKTSMRLLAVGPLAFGDVIGHASVGRAMATGLAKRLRALEAKP
jgi:CRP-like cAMP-binding protein